MKNFATALMAQQEGDEDSVLTRGTYAVGVSLLVLGSVLPHSERWTMFCVALIVFSSLF
jgi:hypothetical protein